MLFEAIASWVMPLLPHNTPLSATRYQVVPNARSPYLFVRAALGQYSNLSILCVLYLKVKKFVRSMDYRALKSSGPKKRIRVRESWMEVFWILGLLLAAVLLFGMKLGNVALRDWDEGTVAQVAREIWQAQPGALRWLYPTLGGQPYLNKPPLVHLLIAGAYALGGVSEWTSRLPGAMLTAISVPLVYGIGREIFQQRTKSIFAALIYLTLLPVVRSGRLAMLDGPVLCFSAFTIWCVLRSRRDLRYCLGASIGFGLICLTKGIMGFLLGAIALLFLFWDTPRLLTSGYLWTGLLLGSVPVIGWYGMQLWHYKQIFVTTGIINQSLQRIWAPVENHSGPPWYYLLEILEYAWPWLIFWPQGLRLAWENRHWGWAKLVLIWTVVYLLAISVMETKLPWYVLPIYPAVALAGGAQLGEVWNWPSSQPYPRTWAAVLGVLGIGAFASCLYFGGFVPNINWHLPVMLASTSLTMVVAAILVVQRDLQFMSVLVWGTYVSLLLFVSSPYWNWELNEAYPVKPVAAIIESGTPSASKVYTSFDYARPSLNFYSDRQVIPKKAAELKTLWKEDPQPYFLINQPALEELQLEGVQRINAVEGWQLITKQHSAVMTHTQEIADK